MFALIDLDMLCYEMGSSVDTEGFPLDWPLVKWRVDQRINTILDAVEATGWEGYLTSQDKSNFRYELATIRNYKEHRQKREKPYWYQDVYSYLARDRGAVVVYGMEADDAMAIAQWENLKDVTNNTKDRKNIPNKAGTIICSRDKDLHMVPGWHYSWETYNQKEKGPWWIEPIEGIRNFYKQLIIGDSADNIHGLYTIGPKSMAYKKIDSLKTELEMFEHVYHWYRKFYGNYAEQFLIENGRLLWMKRSLEDNWNPPRGWKSIVERSKNVDETLEG